MAGSTERAVLAGGCFWGVQDLVRRYPGVISTRVGYTGGEVPNATYRNHGNHAEAIEITFDPAKISYRTLLEFFFQLHDPTTRNRQGNDVGASYRSAIFFTNEEQKARSARHHRRCRGVGSMAGQSGDGSRAGRSILASRARASGLSRALPERLHLPLCSAELGAAEAGPPRRNKTATGALKGARINWSSRSVVVMVVVVVVISVMVVMIGHRVADGRAANSADHSAHRTAHHRSANRAGHPSGHRAA